MIGTDLLLLPFNGPFNGPILKEGESFKLVAANSVKLVSQKLNLVKKISAVDVTSDQDHGTDEFYIPPAATENRKHQTLFLQRLAAIKRTRGDTDKVITQSQKAINASGPRKNKTTSGSVVGGGHIARLTGSRDVANVQALSGVQPSIDVDAEPHPSLQTFDGALEIDDEGEAEEDEEEDGSSTPAPKRQKTT
jgi:hypothetical protein